jgi:small-conductance mechanosensitive channel
LTVAHAGACRDGQCDCESAWSTAHGRKCAESTTGLTIAGRHRAFVAVRISWWTTVLALTGMFGTGEAARAQEPGPEASAGGAVAVTFRGQRLFQVRSPIDTLSPAQRAAAIESRLGAIAAGPSSVLNEVHIVEREQTSDVMAGDNFVLSVSDADAFPTGRTRQQLAADYAHRLRSALAREFSGRSARGIAIGVALTAFATIILIFVFQVLARALPSAERRVTGWEGTLIRGVRIQDVELVSAARLTEAAVRAVRAARWLLLLLVAALYLQAVLGFFPWTRGFAQQIFGYGWGALRNVVLAIAGYLPSLFYIAIIVVVARYVIGGARLVFIAIGRGHIRLPRFHKEWAKPTFQIVRFLMIAFAAVIVFPYLPGSDSPAFQGVSIFLGVLLSLGSTSAVANIVAGVVLTYMLPFRPGDRVKIADTIGDIIEQNLLVVRVQTNKNVEITIPNSTVLGHHIVNYSRNAAVQGLILHSTVTIGYDVPWRTVHELLVSAARKTTGALQEPPPFVLQTALNDFHVSYEVNLYTDQPTGMAAIYAELHANIQDEFAQAGVEIMSPNYFAARDGNQVTIPHDKRPAGLEAPAFRIHLEGGATGSES